MILYFSGTGNSRHAAQRMADALGDTLLSLNDRIRSCDTSPVETGERLVIVTPTYAWRIPRLVRDWLLRTELTGAKQAWFVMTCGSEIGRANHYNRQLCVRKGPDLHGHSPAGDAGELHRHVRRAPGGGGSPHRGAGGTGHRPRHRRRPRRTAPSPPPAITSTTAS